MKSTCLVFVSSTQHNVISSVRDCGRGIFCQVRRRYRLPTGGSGTKARVTVAHPSERVGSSASKATIIIKPTHTEELGSVESKDREEQGEVKTTSSSCLGEGMLSNNPMSKIREADLLKHRYF